MYQLGSLIPIKIKKIYSNRNTAAVVITEMVYVPAVMVVVVEVMLIVEQVAAEVVQE